MIDYKEFLEGMLIKDISTDEQATIGITILHILANKNIEFKLHKHERQSQTISIIKGRIEDFTDPDNIIKYGKGDCFFFFKDCVHSIRYLTDTELIITYMPSFKKLKSHE
jgi:quercetin dioxygenase-like cupin family protein